MRYSKIAVLLAGLLAAAAARADDQPFAMAVATDIDAQGEKEIEQQITWSSGHSREALDRRAHV